MKRADSQRFSRPREAVAARAVRRAEPRHAEPPPVLGAAHDLVAGDKRELRVRQLAVDDVEVGAADAAGRHAQAAPGPAPAPGTRNAPRAAAARRPREAPSRAPSSILSRGDHPAVRLVHGSGDPAPGAGADLPPGVAVRRPHRTARAARLLRRRGRGDARRRHARPRRRAARLRQRLPPPRPRRRRRRAEPRDAAVPVPRLDVRPRRPRSARRRAARRSRTSRRTSSASCPSRSTPGARSSSPTPAPTPEPLAEALGSLPAQVAELGLDVDSLVHHSRWEAEVEANWKIVCENFLECYHCQVAHPGFSELIDVSPDAYALSSDGRLSTQHGPLRTATPQGELPRAQFHFLWPNLGINIFGGRPNISIGPIVPLHARADVPLPRLLLRPGRRAGLDRRPPRLRRPGREGGSGARRDACSAASRRARSTTAC